MKTVALLGYKGFVGRAIYKALQNAGYKVTGVSRETYPNYNGKHFDILINCAMPSKRYWAMRHPVEDFEASAGLTAELLSSWKWKKFVQISTISARCQLDSPYGINRFCAENLVLSNSGSKIVFRLGALYGDGLDKGALFDMTEGKKVFLSGKSKYNYISTDAAAKIIVKNIDKEGIFEIGARDYITLVEVAKRCGLSVHFGDRVENFFTEKPDNRYPKAEEVIGFVMALKKENKG